MTSENIGDFNRSDYSKRTIDTFELMSVYFIDIYYNHLYIEAKNLRTEGKASSITEGYKHTLNAFIQGIENNKHYKKALDGIYDSFVTHGGFISLSFAGCIGRITDEFIPIDYLSAVNKQQKTTILKMIISQVNRIFVERIVRKFMHMIIDNHNEQDNTRILQDEFIDLLILQRENIYHRFIDKQAKKSNQTLSSGIVESMQAEIKKLYDEKYNLKKTITGMKKIIIEKVKILSEKDNIIAKLEAENVQLKDEVSSTQTLISPLQIPANQTEISIPSAIPSDIPSIEIHNSKNSTIENKDSDSDSDISEINMKEVDVETTLELYKKDISKIQPIFPSQDLSASSTDNKDISNELSEFLEKNLFDADFPEVS
jgi:hypothetical protein